MFDAVPIAGRALPLAVPLVAVVAPIARRLGRGAPTRSRFLGRHVRWGLAVGCLLVAVPVASGIANGTEVPGIASLRGRSLGLLSGAVVVGTAAIGLGVGHVRAYRFVQRTEASDPGAVSSGPVDVTGRVAPAEAAVETPFTRREAVCWICLVEERSVDGDGWTTVASGRDGRSFHVVDAIGRVLVAPAGAEFELDGCADRTATVEVDGAEDPPAGIRDWLRERRIASGHRTRRYREWWLAPGDEVYVMGTAVDGTEPTIEAGPGSPRFVVARGSPDEVAATHWRTGLAWLGVGVTLALPAYLSLLLQLPSG